MNMQSNLIWELMRYKFKLGHNAEEATQNICCVKSKGVINNSTVTRKEISLGLQEPQWSGHICLA